MRLRAGSAATLLAAILGLSTPRAQAAQSTAATIDDETTAKEFAAAIDKLNARDPQSPDTLSTRLAYADFLTTLEHGDCRAHLDQARNQLEASKSGPALALVLADAPARIAHLEYQLHLARASCGASAAVRDRELHEALASAQRAVDLYRDAFDAVSMATMQFNCSVVYHDLGEADTAAAALQTTIDMDREYGFADDAEDNYRLLLQWKNEDAGEEQVAARMQDFPQRTATLTFGWFESDAKVTLQSDVSQLADGNFAHFRTSRSAQRQVRMRLGSWRVSYQLEQPHFEISELPSDEFSAPHIANSFARMLTHFHAFSLTRSGDFDDSKSDFKFEMRARADAKALVRDLNARGPDSKVAHSKHLTHLIHAAVHEALWPDAIEAHIAEDYNLAAGTWIGATLEQGVWYDMTASLSLPLAPEAFVMHKIQFTYSRPVPCTPDSSDASCIEIVLRAAPDPEILRASLDRIAGKANLRAGQLQLWSVTSMRLVTDPKTLQTYSREMRRHCYWSSDEPGPDRSLIESERTVLIGGPITRVE
jgi:hypothetical protein